MGKSAVYWAATAALRAAGGGPTLVVSPLLALMRDQIAAAGRAGLRAATVNSTNIDDWDEVLDRDRRRPRRRAAGLARAAGQPGFRPPLPDLLRADRAARDRRGALHLGLGLRLPARLPAPDPTLLGLAPGTPVLATTATANQRVTADVAAQLGDDTVMLRGSLARASLRLAVVPGLERAGPVRLGRRRAAASCPARASSTC